MDEGSNTLEALKLISDWAKWLITIQTAVIAVIGAGVGEKGSAMTRTAKILATGAVACFVASVAVAAVLLLSLPEITQNLRDMLLTHHSREPVSALADLVSRKEANSFSVPCPADLVAYVGHGIYENMNCLSAWQVIPRGGVVGILDTVRTRILNFVLELESEAPDAGEAAPGVHPVPQERVNQVFHTQIYGNVGNVAAGGDRFSQSNISAVVQGDFNSLRTFLSGLGVDPADLAELENATKKDHASPQKGMGENTGQWLGKMIGKAASGTLKVGTTVATTLLTKALAQYWGLPS